MKRIDKLFYLVLILFSVSSIASEKIALIIGNDAYEISPLENAINDANSISNVLKDYGYETHTLIDANKSEILKKLASIKSTIESSNLTTDILFYFAGHGFQFNMSNYLIPLDVNINDKSGLLEGSIDVSSLFQFFESAKNKILILDVCRDEILEKNLKLVSSMQEISIPLDSILAFSTKSGDVSFDTGNYRGFYAQALTHNLRSSDINLQIQEIFNNTRKEVIFRTNGKQNPIEIYNTQSEVVFNSADIKLPPDRYFYGLESWYFNCNFSIDDVNLELIFNIDPSQSQIRSRIRTKENQVYGKWSLWSPLITDDDKNYIVPEFKVHLSKENNSNVKNGKFSRKTKLMTLGLESDNKKRYELLSSCAYDSHDDIDGQVEAYIRSVLPTPDKTFDQLKKILDDSDLKNLFDQTAHLKLEIQAHNAAVYILENNLFGYFDEAFDLLLISFNQSYYLSATEIAQFYRYGYIRRTSQNLDLAYELALLSRKDQRLDYWVEINKWGQELLNQSGYKLKVDGKIGKNTCRAVASYFNWPPASYKCGDVFIKSTLLRLDPRI